MRSLSLAFAGLIGLLPLGDPAASPPAPALELPAYTAADPNAPPVTAASLLSAERFWPYQVEVPATGAVGVLIRVENQRAARIDFGRDGLRDVPIAETDLVARANQVRTGELGKIAPNLVLAIGSRLVDSAGPELRSFPLETAATKPGFLCVFADPAAPGFAALVEAVAPLRDRIGVQTIFFPQGPGTDAAVAEQLRGLSWTVPFVYGHLSEAYTRTLLPDGVAPPSALLLTKEGRLLTGGAWDAALAPRVARELDRRFAHDSSAGSR